MVYEFKVELKKDPVVPNENLYVPLIIYDLPGKEDIKKTFIDPHPEQYNIITNEADRKKKQSKVLPNIEGDIEDGAVTELGIIRTLKAAFIVDLLAVPVLSYKGKLNGFVIYNMLKSYFTTNPLPTSLNSSLWSSSLKGEKVEFPFYDGSSLGFNKYEVNKLFPTRTTISNALASLTEENSGIKLDNVKNISTPYNINDNSISQENGRIAIAISALMSGLIQNNCLDIVIDIINKITGWPIDLIYSYFEAYYINENVVGLLQYLLTTKEIMKEKKAAANKDTFGRQSEQNMPSVIKSGGRKMMMYHLPKNGINQLNSKSLPEVYVEGLPLMNKNTVSTYMTNNGITPGITANEFKPFVDTKWSNKKGPNEPINYAAEYALYHSMIGSYDSTKIFRSGFIPINVPDGSTYTDPINDADKLPNTTKMNYPILRQFLMPYLPSIDYYYIFYVVSNSDMTKKAEEQIKLIDNSLKFIEAIAQKD